MFLHLRECHRVPISWLRIRTCSAIDDRNFTKTSKIFKFFSAFSIACMRCDLSFQYPGTFLFLVCSFASPWKDRRLRVVVLYEIERMKIWLQNLVWECIRWYAPRITKPPMSDTRAYHNIGTRDTPPHPAQHRIPKASRNRPQASQAWRNNVSPSVLRHSHTSFPQAGTARRAVGYWKDVNNQRKFLDSLRAELGLTQVRMWERRLVSG